MAASALAVSLKNHNTLFRLLTHFPGRSLLEKGTLCRAMPFSMLILLLHPKNKSGIFKSVILAPSLNVCVCAFFSATKTQR